MAEDKVKYWQSFHSEMTPQDVADEINRMGLFKNKAKVNKMPRKPKYYAKEYNWISVINKPRINLKVKSGAGEVGMDLNGYKFNGPFFDFDREDKLAEVRFSLNSVPDGAWSLGCYSPVQADGEKGFTYLSNALQMKYKLKREDINYGRGSSSIKIFSDDETRVWLVMEKKYQKSLDTAMFKCNKDVAKVTLHYSDWQRIETKKNAIQDQEKKDAVKDVINTL